MQYLGYKPDVVYTSEKYGDAYAKFMNCEHVTIDYYRINVNISGTRIRENLFEHWDCLHPIVQAHYAIRICVIGAESTGTTTLSKKLAEYYRTNWVPEYGRFYTEGKAYKSVWSSDEFEFIALEQNRIEDKLALSCNKVLICDTNSFATSVWHNRYMGCYSDTVNELARYRKYNLYILTGDEILFVQDGTRDGEDFRHQMHDTFLIKLRGMSNNYTHVTGDVKTRLESSIKIINILIAGFKF